MKKIILNEAEVVSLTNDMDLGAYARKKMNDLAKDNVIFVKRKFFLTEKTNECQNNQILFSSDGKAWVSDGYNSFRVFYNPFDGSMLRLSESSNFDYLPGYLVGKKINNINIDKNKIIFEISEGTFALIPSCKNNSFVNNIEIGQLDSIAESVISKIDYHVDTIHSRDKIQGILKLIIRTWQAEYKLDWIVEDSINCGLNLEKLD